MFLGVVQYREVKAFTATLKNLRFAAFLTPLPHYTENICTCCEYTIFFVIFVLDWRIGGLGSVEKETK